MRRPLVLALVAALAAGWWSAGAVVRSQQPSRDQSVRPPAGTARISGTVVDSAQPPRPVRRAYVTLRAENSGTGWSATTDDDGRFAFADVAAGRYLLDARKAAWITGRYGATRPGRPGYAVVVGDGATVQGLTIAMSRGATISGTVLSRSGEPVPGVTVAATGARVTVPGMDVMTDDEGRFRLFGLPPGEYRVMATPTWRTGPASSFMDLMPQTEAQVQASLRGGQASAAGTVGYASVYAPGVVSRAQALVIKLAPEEERDGVTLTLNPVPTARITVSVDPGDTGDPASVRLSLIPADSGSPLTGRRGGDGRYVFAGVAPVSYTAMARAARLGAAPAVSKPTPAGARGAGSTAPLALYAFEQLDVTGGEMNVSLRLQPGMTVSGRVVAEPGVPGAPRVGDVALALYPLRGSPAVVGVSSVRSGQDGAFRFEGVPPGRYLLTQPTIPPARPAELKSAPYRGVDVLDVPFEVNAGEDVTNLVVTLTGRPAELTGQLTTSAGVAAPDYYIVVFAADRLFWTRESRRIRQTRPATDGRFSITGMPAGEYFVAALTDVEPDEWFQPDFLEQLALAAVRVAIRDGATTVQDLRIR